jgi:hypothetical protein
MKVFLKNETQDGEEYCLLWEAQTKIDKLQEKIECAALYLEWIKNISQSSRKWATRDLAREALERLAEASNPPC